MVSIMKLVNLTTMFNFPLMPDILVVKSMLRNIVFMMAAIYGTCMPMGVENLVVEFSN